MSLGINSSNIQGLKPYWVYNPLASIGTYNRKLVSFSSIMNNKTKDKMILMKKKEVFYVLSKYGLLSIFLAMQARE